jgi:hypothetical protein
MFESSGCKMLDNGVTLKYVYVDGTNSHLFQYSLPDEDCIAYSVNQAHRVLPEVTPQMKPPTPSVRLIEDTKRFGIVNEDGGLAIIPGDLEPLRIDMRKGLLDRDRVLGF